MRGHDGCQKQTAGLNASKKPLMWPGRRAGLNASKKPLMLPGRRRKAMDMALVRTPLKSHGCGLQGEEELWIWPGAWACRGHDWCQKGSGAFGAFHDWQPLMWPGRRRKAMDNMALVPERHATEGARAGLNATKKPLMWAGRQRKAMDMALVPGRQKGFGAFLRVSRLANGRLERQ